MFGQSLHSYTSSQVAEVDCHSTSDPTGLRSLIYSLQFVNKGSFRFRPLKKKTFYTNTCCTFIGGEAAPLLDGDEGPLAIDDLAVEDVVADDEDGSVLRLVIVQVADELPAEGHVADAGFKITLEEGKELYVKLG